MVVGSSIVFFILFFGWVSRGAESFRQGWQETTNSRWQSSDGTKKNSGQQTSEDHSRSKRQGKGADGKRDGASIEEEVSQHESEKGSGEGREQAFLDERNEESGPSIAYGLEGSHFLDARSEGGVESVETTKYGTGTNQSCGDPSHHFNGTIEDAELIVVLILTDSGKFEIVSLKGEEFCFFCICFGKADDDSGEGIPLREGS